MGKNKDKNNVDKIILIAELEYSRILNNQNTLLGFFGAFLLTTVSIDEIPKDWGITKSGIILIIVVIAVYSYIHFNKRLEKKLEEITKL